MALNCENAEVRNLEKVLNNSQENFEQKVRTLIKIWEQINISLAVNNKGIEPLMHWIRFHTLNIILDSRWKKYKDYEGTLLKEISLCELQLLHANNAFFLRCRKLAETVQDPWENEILHRLLTKPDIAVGPTEMRFFFKETGFLTSTRLRKLSEDQCTDMALNFATSFMHCQQLAEQQHVTLNVTDDQMRFILDVYIALLYRKNDTKLILLTLKTLPLEKGLELVNRFAHKRVSISKIWKESQHIAHISSQFYATTIMTVSPEEDEENNSILQKLLRIWLTFFDLTESFMNVFRRIVQHSVSAVYIYTVCEAIYEKFGQNSKALAVEMFVRALTADINDLERRKDDHESEKAEEIQNRLASGYLSLADVLNDHLLISRECLLTAFSLQPTQATLGRLIKLANCEALDTGQNYTDEVPASCDDFISQPQFRSTLSTINTALHEAVEDLDLSRELCDDLIVVLSSPRYQLLSWLLPWKDLSRLCNLYLKDPEGTKNHVKELKFLEIDYSKNNYRNTKKVKKSRNRKKGARRSK